MTDTAALHFDAITRALRHHRLFHDNGLRLHGHPQCVNASTDITSTGGPDLPAAHPDNLSHTRRIDVCRRCLPATIHDPLRLILSCLALTADVHDLTDPPIARRRLLYVTGLRTTMEEAQSCPDPHDLGLSAALVILTQAVTQFRLDPHLPPTALATAPSRNRTERETVLQLLLSEPVDSGPRPYLFAVNATVAAALRAAGMPVQDLPAPLTPEQRQLLAQTWDRDLPLAEQVQAVLAATT